MFLDDSTFGESPLKGSVAAVPGRALLGSDRAARAFSMETMSPGSSIGLAYSNRCLETRIRSDGRVRPRRRSLIARTRRVDAAGVMPIAAPQPGKPLPSVGRRVEPHADSAGNVAGQTFNARFVICFFHRVSFECLWTVFAQ
jgi:hypothetical protein